MGTGVAIVIPVFDDAEALAQLLPAIARWPLAPDEVVVVAAAEDSALTALCSRFACRLIRARANRGEQLDRGARQTTAPVLWFLHADAEPPGDGLAAIMAAIEGGADGGCFRFEFQGPRTRTKRVLERLVGLRIRCGGIAYGDQGLFARRDAYLAAGGFRHQPLFEEVSLVRGLRKRRRFRVLERPLRVATRRWVRDGWWRRSWRNRWLALCYACGVPAERLAAAYHRQVSAPPRPEP
jgi:rSAM/selenodomain-associated transferase 2